MGCLGLKDITIPNGITIINSLSFAFCTSLESVTVPDSVIAIKDTVFAECSNLTGVTILNPDCYIYDESDTLGSDAAIHGYENSTAQAYADKYGKSFSPIRPVNIEGITATCTEDGYTAGVYCDECKKWISEREVIPAFGHSWQDATCSAPRICSVCGETEGEALSHSDDNKDGKCDKCGSVTDADDIEKPSEPETSEKEDESANWIVLLIRLLTNLMVILKNLILKY